MIMCRNKITNAKLTKSLLHLPKKNVSEVDALIKFLQVSNAFFYINVWSK